MKKNRPFFVIAFCLLIGTIGNAQPYYIGAYIRGPQYESGTVGTTSMQANNDLMYIGFNPYSTGQVFCEYPIADASFTGGASYAPFVTDANNVTRYGIVSFDGAAGTVMDGGQDFLVAPTTLSPYVVGASTFSFATWVYVNTGAFSPSEYLFQKINALAGTEVSLSLATDPGQLSFKIATSSTVSYTATASAAATAMVAGNWYHIALVYKGSGANLAAQVQMYVNGAAVATTLTSLPTGATLLPAALPAITQDFNLGSNFNGYMDETMVNTLALGSGDINSFYKGTYTFTSFNQTKTVAFWNYDNAADLGNNVRSYVYLLNDIKSKMTAGTKLRISITSGAWQAAVSTSATINTLAKNLNSIITSQNLDGVDVDMEWPTANTEAAFKNYSNFIVALKAAIGSKTLSISLHPYFYEVGPTAIATADYINLQVYGPQTALWPMSAYILATNNATSYGIPANKLVMGLPFYSTTGIVTSSYKSIIAANPGITFDADQATVSGTTYTFNGVTTIYNKAKYITQNALAGIMSWDLSNDMTDYNNSYSLMNATIRGLAATVLPVTLYSFKGTLQKGTAQLQWQSGVEINFNHYEIQKSLATTSQVWQLLGKTLAKGSNNNYSFSIPQMEAMAFYRLKMVDNDGTETFSNVEMLSQNNTNGGVAIYPNPAKSNINIRTVNAGSFSIYDVVGKLVKTQLLQPGVTNIQVSGLSAGTYYGIIGGEKVKFTKE